MKIALLGSTGFVGKILTQKALDARHDIKTLVRTPEKLGEFKERVEYITGNAFNTPDVLSAISGTDAVLSTIAPSKSRPGSPLPYQQAMENLVNAMQQCGIKRLIHIGGAAHAGGENEQWSVGRRFLRMMLTLTAQPILEAKRLEWDVLKRSPLEWTLVRPSGIIKSAPRGTLYADEKRLASLTVNVEDLTEFMLQQIASRAWIRKAPLVASRK